MTTPVLSPAFAMFDVMPVPVMSFDVRGALIFANQAAKAHPAQPHLVMSKNNETKLLIANLIAGNLKLLHGYKLELPSGERIEGQFVAGPEAHLLSFVAVPFQRRPSEAQEAKRLPLITILNFLGSGLGAPSVWSMA